MNKVNLAWLAVFALLGSFFISPKVAFAVLDDGTYSINYTVVQGDGGSASMANDYFDKPATLVVANGQSSIQLQLNHSKWITGLWVDAGNGLQSEQIISTDDSLDTRKVSFQTGDLSAPIAAKIKVDIENSDLSYHHEYKINLSFDLQSASLIAGSAVEKTTETQGDVKAPEVAGASTTEKVPNPKSGDQTPIYLYSLLFIGALGSLFVFRKTAKVK
ncbi:heme uptake protein IsdC [Carnobacterium maltaromaticum]|uniref:heme uptake protein IsdC n=1 Tax=Carnobacterium maltaromaticum TaxID=2751 RepID=UPI00295F2033|nr:heme uptake protein IsdC [Carnobacterium maltaromaticum]